MNRKMILTIAAILVVVIGGAGVSYWAVKKIRAKQRQEYRYEGVMQITPKAGFNEERFKNAILSDDLLDAVIDKHQLVDTWQVADRGEAKQRIKQKFFIRQDGKEIKISYQDRNKELAKAILQSIVMHFRKKVAEKAAEL